MPTAVRSDSESENIQTIVYTDKYFPGLLYSISPALLPTPAKQKKKKEHQKPENDRHNLFHSRRHLLTHVSSSYYFAAAIVPQAGQRRLSSSVIQRSMSGLRSLPRSVTWNDSSRITVGVSCCPGVWQYQRKRSCRSHKKHNI